MSFVQLGGFLIMVLGLCVYYGAIKFKWSVYDEE